jgi:hypothetical protein
MQYYIYYVKILDMITTAIQMPEDELMRINSYRFRRRFSGKSAAIRHLIKTSLDAFEAEYGTGDHMPAPPAPEESPSRLGALAFRYRGPAAATER